MQMKKLLLWLCVLVVHNAYSQTLNSVSPDTALLGTTLTAQISGTGTLFQSSSPQGFFLEQGLTSIYASLSTANYFNDQSMEINFVIPPGAPSGSYNLVYSYFDTTAAAPLVTLTLSNAVNIVTPSLYLSGNVFVDTNNNGVKDGAEVGLAGQRIFVTPDNQTFYSKPNGDYTIPTFTGNKTIAWQNNNAGYVLSAGSQASYTGNYSANTSGLDFGVINSGPALVSITPDSVMAGTTLNAVISALGTVLQNSSPQGAINFLYATDPLQISYAGTGGNPVNIISNTSFSTSLVFPLNAPAGYWNLVVNYFDTTTMSNINLILPNSILVHAPEIFLEGNAYADRDSNALHDITEGGVSNQDITITPDNQNFITDNLGNYKIPTSRGNKTVSITPNGNWVVNPLAPSSISGNYISTTAGLDFPLLGPGPYLTSITPDSALAGTTLQALISGYGTVFQSSSPPSSIIEAALFRNSPTSVYYFALQNSIVSLDDENFTADFPIPANANPGLYNLSVTYEDSPFNYVTLVLPNSVTITQPQLFLEGYAYLDLDSDGIKDAGEPGLPNQKIIVQPDNQYVFTDNTGLFQAGSFPGTHTITWDSLSSPFELNAASPPSYTANVNQTTSGYDFGLNSLLPPYECSLLTLHGAVRCNNSNYTYVSFKNTGIVPYDARITIIKSSNTSFNAGGTVPSYVSGDTIVFNVTNLQPQQQGTIYFYLIMPAAGSTISTTAIIESLDGSGNVVSSDSQSRTTTVTCAFDPNDKAVTPAGVQSANYTLMSETLEYLIRFQNTGNDTAFTVVIRDTIDIDLNLSTFMMIDASHAVQTQVDVATRIVTFTFNNILLVDSNMNEPLSHGYVKYSIKPNAGLINVTAVQNTAHIYFDFNDPIATNTTLNTLVYSIPTSVPEILPSAKGIVSVMPNPFTEEAYIVFSNDDNNKYRLKVLNLQGKLVMDNIIESEKILIEKKNLNSGLYFFMLAPIERGQTYSGKFIIK